MNQQIKRLKGYEAPEAETFVVSMENNILSGEPASSSSIENLDDVDYSGSAIWS